MADWVLEGKTEQIEVTVGPTPYYEGDQWRKFRPGVTHYTVTHLPTGRVWDLRPGADVTAIADALTLGADPDLPDAWLRGP